MGYPPPHHLLRDLRIVSRWTGELESRFAAPFVPEVAGPDGLMAIGAVFAVADLAAASTAMAGAHGDWVGTLDLSLRMSDAIRVGPLVIDGMVMRAGGTLITVRSELYDGVGTEEARRFVGTGIGSFRRMPRNPAYNTGASDAEDHEQRRVWARPESGFTQPLESTVGITERTPGVVELAKTGYVTNSFGTVNGGATGILIAAAASSAVAHELVAVDIDVRYVAQAGDGPVRTASEVIRRTDEHAVVDVMVEDHSRGGQVIAAGSVTLLDASLRPTHGAADAS